MSSPSLSKYQDIKSRLRFNKFEHKQEIFTFVSRLFFYGAVGILIGALINLVIVKTQGIITGKKIDSIKFLAFQLAVISITCYVALYEYKKFDEWIWESFSGMMFWIGFITAQTRLIKNIETVLEST